MALLGEEVHAARNWDTEARSYPRPRSRAQEEEVLEARRKLRLAQGMRKRKLKEWETSWWQDIGKRASEASRTGDTEELYRILREMKVRGLTAGRDGGNNTVADIEGELEAWKEHFRKVSETEGALNPNVWENVSRQKPISKWLGAPPSNIEMDKCVGKMKLKKAAGKDMFPVEILKYGGKKLRDQVYEVVRTMWVKAGEADAGEEGVEWPEEWKIGLVVPLWKRKNPRSNKTNWRGVTLLSVGSKLLARIVAMRIQAWTETWLHESNSGFRRGRGVDDALQVSRRLVEEAVRSTAEGLMVLSFYDIEKAYPRVAIGGLWELMKRKGCDERMIKVCKALHESTQFCVRMYGKLSEPYLNKRGLREGCPSSPPLFNIYHDGVMEDFRERRRKAAEEEGKTPGVRWQYRADGKLDKKGTRERCCKKWLRTRGRLGWTQWEGDGVIRRSGGYQR